MTPVEITSLRRIYGEICRGYSETTWDGKPVYVAHLTTFDQTDIDIIQDDALQDAVNRGIKTEKDKVKYIMDKGYWTQKQESELNGQRFYVEGLEKTLSNLPFKLQIEQVTKQLNEGRADLSKMIDKRIRAIGLTAERVAEQRVQLEYIRASFCRDADLREPLFTEHTMRELSDEESDDLLIAYVGIVSRFSVDNIRRIAVQPFFVNQFSLCGEHLHDFFGIPIVDLTIYQANLLSYGQYYRNVFSHHTLPKDVASDPDKIEEYITRQANLKDLKAKSTPQQGGFVGYVGASKEDIEAMGEQDGTAKMQQAANKQYKDGKDAAKDMGFVMVDKH